MDCLFGLFAYKDSSLNIILFHLFNFCSSLSFGIDLPDRGLAMVHHHVVVIVGVEDLMIELEWIVVFDIYHDLVKVVLDVVLGGLIPNDLIGHHPLLLLVSKVTHLLKDMSAHLAAIMIKHVLLGLQSSQSFLFWVSKVQVAFSIIVKSWLFILFEESSTCEISFLSCNFLTCQNLHLVWLSARKLLQLHLQAVHASHPSFALEGNLPSSQQSLMFKVEVFVRADCILQVWAFARVSILQDLVFFDLWSLSLWHLLRWWHFLGRWWCHLLSRCFGCQEGTNKLS